MRQWSAGVSAQKEREATAPLPCTIDFGDGSPARDVYRRGNLLTNASHTYTQPGTYNVHLAMSPAEGAPMTQDVRIRVLPQHPADPAELLKVTPNRWPPSPA